MNIFDEHPFKVILDYAHNPAAVRAISSLVSKLEVNGRRIAVLSAPGDRRDEDICEVAEIASEHFDLFICKADDHRRGRADDEVPKIMKSALLGKGINKNNIQVIPDEQDAINAALKIAEEGDCVLILGDAITRSWKQIIHFESESKKTAEKSASSEAPDSGLEETPFTMEEGQKLIQDERGVRLAREESD